MGGGGAERQLAYLAAGLTKLDWEVHVALLTGGPNLRRLEESGARIHRIAFGGSYDPLIILRLRGLMRKLGPDLLQTWLPQMDVLGGYAVSGTNIPWVLNERSSSRAYPGGVRSWLRLRQGSKASAIICNSREGERYWRDQVRFPKPIYVIPNGLPCAEIDRWTGGADGVPDFPASQKIILYVGSFSAPKNIQKLIEALAIVVNKDNCIALLCGEGQLRGHIESFIAVRGLSTQIRFVGYLDPVWPLLKRSDVFLSVSLFEGQPNTVLEAMAAGCNLVVSDIPSHREVLTNRSAVFVDPLDAEKIAEGIRSVLANPDPAMRKEARRLSEGYSIESTALKYRECFELILGPTP
jgi:glycosyltransferase involved in cell wall biosynthesis